MVSFADMAAYVAGTKALAPATMNDAAAANSAQAAGVSGSMLSLYQSAPTPSNSPVTSFADHFSGSSDLAAALGMVSPSLGNLVGGVQAATGTTSQTTGSKVMAFLPNLELIVLGVVIFSTAIFLGVGSSVANSVVKKAVSLGAMG